MTLTDDILDEIGIPGGRPRRVSELPGGLTNHNYRVDTPAGCWVVRQFDDDSSALAIDRDAEHANSVRAAAAGVGAPVLAYRPDLHVLVVEYIDGVTFDNDSFAAPGVIPRVAAACRTLHAGEPFVNDFDMFELQPKYLQIVQDRGFRFPDGYLDYADHVRRIRAALQHAPLAPAPCNNDLLAANFIDDGAKIWLIDYEYAGNNDPCFELGNIWSECRLDDDQLEELVFSYFERPAPDLVARARLQALMSKYGWTLWGAIQAATSPIDFDFWEWATERYDGARAVFDGSEFDRLLDEAAR